MNYEEICLKLYLPSKYFLRRNYRKIILSLFFLALGMYSVKLLCCEYRLQYEYMSIVGLTVIHILVKLLFPLIGYDKIGIVKLTDTNIEFIFSDISIIIEDRNENNIIINYFGYRVYNYFTMIYTDEGVDNTISFSDKRDREEYHFLSLKPEDNGNLRYIVGRLKRGGMNIEYYDKEEKIY